MPRLKREEWETAMEEALLDIVGQAYAEEWMQTYTENRTFYVAKIMGLVHVYDDYAVSITPKNWESLDYDGPGIYDDGYEVQSH